MYNLLEIKERPLLWRKMSWASACLRKRWAEIMKYFKSTFAVDDHCSITSFGDVYQQQMEIAEMF